MFVGALVLELEIVEDAFRATVVQKLLALVIATASTLLESRIEMQAVAIATGLKNIMKIDKGK